MIKYFLSAILMAVTTYSFAQEAPIGNCKPADFVSPGGPEVVIETFGHHYTPPCLKVAKGTKVTIFASGNHPLQGSNSIGTPESNPFIDSNGAGFDSSQTRILDTAGIFGYFCTRHGNAEGQGMAGVIIVE